MFSASRNAPGGHGATERVRLLHVEDDPLLVMYVGRALRRAGFYVDTAVDAAGALGHLEEQDYQIALIDWRLPGPIDGLSLARWLRARSPSMGIVMLSGVSAPEARHQALGYACDDYLVKPCDLSELLARLRAVLRRTSRPPSPVFSWGPFRVDLIGSRVWVGNGEITGLQPLQVRFLAYLVQNAGRTCTHEELSELVFRSAQGADSTSRARAVSMIRSRCGSAGHLIATVEGIGYGVGIGRDRLGLPKDQDD